MLKSTPLLAKTFYVFYEWPKQYHSFLDWLNNEDRDEDRGRNLRRGFRAYEYSLYRLMRSREYEFMRREFEEYAKSKFGMSYISTIDKLKKAANLAQRASRTHTSF